MIYCGETVKLEELIALISEKTGMVVNQSMLAEGLGITRQTVSNRIKNESEVTVSELKRVEDFFNITLFSACIEHNENLTFIDYYSDVFASCGNGSIIFSTDKVKIPLAVDMIKNYSKNKLYSIIRAKGNSMYPTIDDGDKLIVEHWNGDQIQDNKIYVFCYNNEFFVKRLAKNVDELIIKSDNPEYRVRTISGKAIQDLILVGEIVTIIRQI